MKQSVKYQVLSIPNKIRVDVRLVLDDERPCEYVMNSNGTRTATLTMSPIINFSILHPAGVDDNGMKVRVPWNPNDTITTTKFTFPLIVTELQAMQSDMKLTELYTYTGDRLELNETAATKVRHVFMIGNNTIEVAPVVIVNSDESHIEGIKIKFNTEQSVTYLTVNEFNSLIYNLIHLDIDNVVLLLYTHYAKKNVYTPAPTNTSTSDIPDIIRAEEAPF